MADTISVATAVTANEFNARKALVDYRVALYLLLVDPKYGLNVNLDWKGQLVNNPGLWSVMERCKGVKFVNATEDDIPVEAPAWSLEDVQRGAGLYFLYQDANILHDKVYNLIYQTGVLKMNSDIPTVQDFIKSPASKYITTKEFQEAITLYNGRRTDDPDDRDANEYHYVRPSAESEEYATLTSGGVGNAGDLEQEITENPATLINNTVWSNFTQLDAKDQDGCENVKAGSFPVNPETQDPRPGTVVVGNHNLIGGQWNGWNGAATQFPSGTGPDATYVAPAIAAGSSAPNLTSASTAARSTPIVPKQTKFDQSMWVRSGANASKYAKSAASSRAIVTNEQYDSSKDQVASPGQQTAPTHAANVLKSVVRTLASYRLPSCSDCC